MDVKKTISEKFIYNYRIKKFIASALQSPLLVNNPAYGSIYKKFFEKKMKIFAKRPLRVMVENTNLCDGNCVFCPHKIMVRRKGIMKMVLFEKIIEECKKFGVSDLTLHGFGEPLLDKDFFKKVKLAKEAGISRVITNTNGMYLTKEKIDGLFSSGLNELFISFDAATEQTYKKIRPGLDFSTVEKNILTLVKQKQKRGSSFPKIILSFVETIENLDETRDYFKKWKNQVDDISVSFLHNWGGSLNKRGIPNQGKRDPCRLLWTDMVIFWNGDVPLCCSDYEGKILLGNILSSSLKEIWGSERLRKIQMLHKTGEFKQIILCRNCSLNYHFKLPWWGS